MDSSLEGSVLDSTLERVKLESLREETALEQVLQDFVRRFKDKVPQKLEYCAKFLEKSKILQLAEQEKPNALDKLVKALLDLGNADKERCDAIYQQFDPRIERLINDEFVAKHEAYRKKANELIRNRIAKFCTEMKSSLMEKLKAKPAMDIVKLQKIIQDERKLAISGLKLNWCHGNVTLYEDNAKRFSKKLDQLADEVLKNHREQLEAKKATEKCQAPTSHQKCVPAKTNLPGPSTNKEKVQNVKVSKSILGAQVTIMDSEPENDIVVNENRQSSTSADTMKSEPERDGERQVLAPHAMETGIAVIDDDSTSPKCSFLRNISSVCENDSLIFFLRQDKIEMTMLISGTFQSPHNHQKCSSKDCDWKNLQWCIKSGFGVNKDGKLQCDEQEIDEFSLEKLLQETPRSKPEMIRFKLGQRTLAQDVNIEFLLGFLLKNQKASAETYLQRIIGKCIIIVPMWLTSQQRIQFKDAAMIAGFDNVNLLNEESITAYASEKLQNTQAEHVILIFGHKFKMISASLFDWNGNTITLMSTSFFDVTLSNGRLLKWIQQFLSESMEKVDNGRMRKALFPAAISVAEKLSDVLQRFRFEYKNVPVAEYGHICSIFEKIQVEDLRDFIQEFSPGLVGYCHEACKIILERPRFSTRSVCKMPTKHLQKDAKLDIREYLSFAAKNEEKGIAVSALGKLEFRGHTRQLMREVNENFLQLTFKVSSEGIISLDVGSLKLLLKSRKPTKISRNDFTWSPPTLDVEERVTIAQILSELVPEADFNSEQPTILLED